MGKEESGGSHSFSHAVMDGWMNRGMETREDMRKV